MEFKRTSQLSIALLVAVLSFTGVAEAQENATDKDTTQAAVGDHVACFDSDINIVDDLPKRKRATSKSEQQIIDKIIHFVTHDFTSQQAAFLDLDKNHDCKLDKSEVSNMLSKSHVNGLIRLFATSRLIDRYDVSKDDYVEWPEFYFAIGKALEKQAERKAKQH